MPISRHLSSLFNYSSIVLLTRGNFDEVRTACRPKSYRHTTRLPSDIINSQNLPTLQKRCRFLDTSRHYLITVLLTRGNFDEVRTACRPKSYRHTTRLPSDVRNSQNYSASLCSFATVAYALSALANALLASPSLLAYVARL